MARFYLDENITEELAVRLTALGNDAVTTNALRRKGARDQQQLLFAAQQNRILITSNGEDFRLLHDAWRDWSAAWGTPPTIARHAEILLIPQNKTGLTVEEMAQTVHEFTLSAGILDNRLAGWTRIHGWQEVV